MFSAVALGNAAAAVMAGVCGAFTELFRGRVWLEILAGGLTTSTTMAGFIHFLLVVAIVLVLVRVITGRRPV